MILAGLASWLSFAASARCQTTGSSGAARAAVKYDLLCAGSDELVYFLIAEWKPHEQGTYDNWLAFVDKSSSEIQPLPGPISQSLRPRRMALAGQNVHIFYSDGTHYRHTPALAPHGRRELRLPNPKRDAVPEAVAGDVVDRVARVWAVVSAETAASVAAEYERVKGPGTRPARSVRQTRPAATRPAFAARPAGGYAIVSYDGQFWRPEFPAPAASAAAENLWLAVSRGRIHLLWQNTVHDSEIQYARYEDGEWVVGPAIRLPGEASPVTAFLGIGNRRLVFVAMMPRSGGQWYPHVYLKPELEGEWTPTAPLLTSDAQPLLLPSGSVAAVFSDLLAVFCPGAEKPEVALWHVSGGKPQQPFAAIPRGRLVMDPGQRSQRDLLVALGLGMLLLLIFWRRHATFAAPVALPAGYALAGTGRRVVAALLDMTPAAAIVIWRWGGPLQAVINEAARTGADQAQFEAVWADVIFWPSVVFRLIYFGYCLGFELFGVRTPGKWLLGCSVLSETGGPPTKMQALIRNASRLVELHPDPTVFLPLLLLVFITRNRQRVGDLIARTIVVESAPILESSDDSGSA